MEKKVAAFAFIALVAVAGIFAWHFTSPPQLYSGPAEPIVLGGLVTDANTMIFTAEDRHFFATNGINFTDRTYDSGLATIDDMLKGKLDIAGAAEYPVVAKAFQKDNISIIASICKSDIIYLVGLNERGIRNISDLKGKKIGIPRGTVLEFYLGRFLDLHGMSIRDVTLINLPQGQTTDAFADGSVDAIVTREPYFSQVQKQQAKGIISWSVQSNQAVYSVLICRNVWIKEHPELIRRFLNSLAEAEEYIMQHPAGAKAILQARYHYDDKYVARVWPEQQFSLSLDQSLITAMEDEGRWMIANNMTNASNIPDLRNYVYKDGLEAVRPVSVNIIG